MKTKNLTKHQINGKFEPYEEDGQMITERSKICLNYKCKWANKPLIKNDKGFLVCPTCGGSYGKIQ